MSYYILYKRKSYDVKIVTKRPNPDSSRKAGYGFAEGPFRTQKDVIYRLNRMNIPAESRPIKYRRVV